MAITVGSYTFDERHTTVKESYERVGGKETRRIEITGICRGEADRDALDGVLDDLMAAASESGVYVSLRAGRRILSQRESLERTLNEKHLVGQFVLVLRADTPYEESEAVVDTSWNISVSGEELAVSQLGNAPTFPVIALTTAGTVVSPRFSDGSRTILYDGVLEAGSLLILDGESGIVSVNGVDVTPYTIGDFPQVNPEGATLIYADEPISSHLLEGNVSVRSRWW